jgi:phenylacetate-CoA ligase
MHAVKRWATWTKRTVIGDAFIRRMPFWYRPPLQVFEQLARAPLAERKAWSLQRLERVLQAAQETEYGRQIGRARAITDWPLLEKDLVRESPARFLRTPQWRTVPASTSGTTGLPLQLFRSYASIGAEQAAIDWLYFARGYDPRQLRVAVLRGENIKSPSDRTPPFWRWDANGRRLVLSSNHLSADTIEDYYQILAEFAPDCLFAYPSALESLCQLLLQREKCLRIPLVVCSSEMPTDSTRPLAEQALNAELIDYYGQAERVAFAYSFQQGAYYFLPGYAWTELVPVTREPDGVVYEIVGTSLWNLAMPLVRYRTRDFIKLPEGVSEPELEAICFGLTPFEKILGRSGDVLIAPDGTVLTGIDHIPRDVAHVVRMQVIQERSDYVRILVLPTHEFNDADRQQILTNARLKIPESMEVVIEIVDELVRTAQMKTPFVIRKMSGEGTR